MASKRRNTFPKEQDAGDDGKRFRLIAIFSGAVCDVARVTTVLSKSRQTAVEQIIAEYKVRALQYHPDKNDGDKEAEAMFQKLKLPAPGHLDYRAICWEHNTRNTVDTVLALEKRAIVPLLRDAKETLCDPMKRKNYDKWRNSGIAMSYKQWLSMKEHVHQSMHWTNPKTKDRMLGEGESSAGGAAAGGSPGGGRAPPANRRASEGGANIHWSGANRTNVQWDSKAPSEIVNKFRNYEI
ncbi:hypothetical protein AAG570_002588 [Ranatra chinensis]|uniref:J domain-containing protein n=1 Tax=Ranatra chinensis TaxID=642074 RepID=A0ABD0Y813_9HEMI